MTTAQNDNAPAPGGAATVRIIGHVGEDGRVTITDPSWRPTPRPAPRAGMDGDDGRPER